MLFTKPLTINSSKISHRVINNIVYNESVIEDPNLIAEHFNKTFITKAIELASGLTISNSSSVKCNEVNFSSFFISPSSEHEVLQVIRLLKNRKAYDIYDISTPINKAIALNIAKILSHIFIYSISEGVVPAGLKYIKVVPVHKAKDKTV
jgi:hypothetical protein